MRKPAIHICFVCHQGKPFLPSQPKSLQKTMGFGQSRSGSKYSTSAGCCTRRQMQTQPTWRPGLAQGISGQFDGMHGSQRTDSYLALLFLGLRRWHSDADLLGAGNARTGLSLPSHWLPCFPSCHVHTDSMVTRKEPPLGH